MLQNMFESLKIDYSLFTLPLDVIGRARSVNVAHPGQLLYYFNIKIIYNSVESLSDCMSDSLTECDQQISARIFIM